MSDPTPVAPFHGRVDGADVDLVPGDDGLTVGGRFLDWCDVDAAAVVDTAPVRLRLRLADGSALLVDRLGRRGDLFADLLRDRRGRARRAALTQAAVAPLAAFVAHEPSGRTVDVTLYPHVVTVEPRTEEPAVHLPLPLVRDVARDGWVLTLAGRGVDDVVVRGLGPQTDEFEQRLARARADLATVTREAIAASAPAAAGLDAPDGWAVGPREAGRRWNGLVAAWSGMSRATEVGVLRRLVGDDRWRCGMWTEGGTTSLPFVLAGAGQGPSARVVVEAVDADDRATFVYATDDVDRLNAALVLSAFRREVFSLPDDALGRWAVAVRVQPHVQWARDRLVARVVHDAGWEQRLTTSLSS